MRNIFFLKRNVPHLQNSAEEEINNLANKLVMNAQRTARRRKKEKRGVDEQANKKLSGIIVALFEGPCK